MNRKFLTSLISIAAIGATVGAGSAANSNIHKNINHNNVKNVILLSNHENNNNNNANSNSNSNSNSNTNATKYKVGITTAFIGIPQQDNGFAADPNFNPNGFASPLNKKLYEYESVPANQNAAMDEAITLHGGNPEDTCVFFQSSALRAIGVPVPDSIGYTLDLEKFLGNNGWQRETDFNYIQKGDICFAGPYHTFLFMGWKDKAKGIAYVMGDEAYVSGQSYRNRNLDGQSANASDGWNNQYQATCYWKYTGNYTGKTVQNAPSENFIGRVAVQSPVGLWMNSAPSIHSNQLQCIGDNIILNVIAQKNGWYEVYYNGQTGWVDGQYTTVLANAQENNNKVVQSQNISGSSNYIGTTTTTALEGLDLNYSPSFDSGAITTIPYDTTLQVFAQNNNGWYKVYYNGNYGWIYAEDTNELTSSQSGSTGNTPSNNNSKVLGQVTVTSPIGLWMNNGPSTTSGNIVCLNYNTTVNVIGQKNGWYEIQYNGQTGWIDGEYTTGLNQQNQAPSQKQVNNKTFTTTSVNGTVQITAGSGLYMNKKPFVNDGNILIIPNGTKLHTTEKSSTGWYKVSYKGQTGWIGGAPYSKFIPASNQQKPSNPSKKGSTPQKQDQKGSTTKVLGQITVTSPIGLWMNNGPSTTSGNIVCLNDNTTLNVIGQKNGWYEVQYDGQTGWVDGQYTTALKSNNKSNPAPAPKPAKKTSFTTTAVNGTIQVTVGSGLYMNEKPFVNDGNILIIPNGTKLHTTEKSSNGWYKVTYDGQTGWIGGTPYSKFTPAANQQKPSNPSKKGSTPQKQDQKGSTTKVLGQITVTSPIGLWMNNGPSIYSGNIVCLNDNTTLNVIGQKNGWYEVQYDGQTGWVDGEYTTSLSSNSTPTPNKTTTKVLGQTTVTSPIGLWMNNGPSIYSGNIVCLNDNTTVNVIGENNGWYEIQYDGQTGWIDGEYTTGLNSNSSQNSNSTPVTPAPTPASVNNTILGQVTVTSPVGLWIDNGPSIYSGNTGTCLNYNTTVNVIGESNGWYEIQYYGQTGWIDGQYTTALNSNSSSQIIGQTTVVSPIGLWMNNGPSIYSGTIVCLDDDTTVNVIGQVNGWYQVQYNGQTGWIDAEYTTGLS